MEREAARADVPETGGPCDLCVKRGDPLLISGLPPSEEGSCARLRAARAEERPVPPTPGTPFERQVEIVMNRMKLPARTRMQAGRMSMDCSLMNCAPEVEAIGYVPSGTA